MTRKTKTRQAKIYFLRGRTPRQVREKLRKVIDTIKGVITEDPEPKEEKGVKKEAPHKEEPQVQQKEEQEAKQQQKSPEKEQSKEPSTEKTEQSEKNNTEKERSKDQRGEDSTAA